VNKSHLEYIPPSAGQASVVREASMSVTSTPSSASAVIDVGYPKASRPRTHTLSPHEEIQDATTPEAALRAVTSTVANAARDAFGSIRAQLEQRPHAVLAVGAGLAFGLGTLVGSRVIRWLAVLGGGYALARVVAREVAPGR
jgi:hypothetical protein